MKSNDAKRVNRKVRQINKKLKEDVFGNRFELRQKEKCFVDGMEMFLYKLIDNEQPERNKDCDQYYTVYEICQFHYLDIQINNFIVNSDFWKKQREL